MTIITTCPNCNSRDITDLNGDLRKTSGGAQVTINAQCDDCNHEFEYIDATDSGRRSGILY